MDDENREYMLEQLIGIRSSRRTYYSEYRENERRLDRAIASIADISAALCSTTSGVPKLVQAVAQVAVRHFDAAWAAITLNDPAAQPWIARRNADGTVDLTAQRMSVALKQAVDQVLDQQQLVFADAPNGVCLLGAPMLLSDQVVGALVVALSPTFSLDERELSVLRTLANQAAVAVENARLYEESERLRAQATALYEEACRQKTKLEEKNLQLAKARRLLAAARHNEILHSERNRIARDLHDSVAQHLISIGMTLEWCRLQLHQHPLILERVCTAKEMARSAVTRMRETIFQLASISSGRASIIAALHESAMDFEKASNLQVELRISGEPRLLAGEVEYVLYFIAQEALYNVHKHAQARNVSLELRFMPKLVQLIIADDGIGIDSSYLQPDTTPAEDAEAHFGLRNMRERVGELGGKLRIKRLRHNGTEIRVTVPTELVSARTQGL